MVKHKSISREFFLVQEKIKEKKIKFLLKQYNSKYSTINNHKRFIFKIYFLVIRFSCNYQYFSLHAYTVKPLYKKPFYKKNLFIRKLYTHLIGIQPFPH